MKISAAATEVVEAATTAATKAMKAAAAATKGTATTETTAASTEATTASETATASTKAATAAAVSDERSGRSGCQVPGCEPTRRGIRCPRKAENACDETTEKRTM
jgi:hypothetical protein